MQGFFVFQAFHCLDYILFVVRSVVDVRTACRLTETFIFLILFTLSSLEGKRLPAVTVFCFPDCF